jgi:hypothetical protein
VPLLFGGPNLPPPLEIGLTDLRKSGGAMAMWEIVVLDYFEVGDSTAGLFCCGRLWYWTILKWEILLLDFFEVGDSDAGLSS